MTIAYLTNSYARATDTFIRDEVMQLRAAGDHVVTFSIRKSEETQVLTDEIAAERARTTYLLETPRIEFLAAFLSHLLLRPRRLSRAVGLARLLVRPGLRGTLWPLFYLLEACLLASRLLTARAAHLHNHIGEGSASVAMLAAEIAGIPYSFTVHGPSEWDRPHELSLDLKVRHAAFVVVISEYTRGQLRRWVSHHDWDKIHVVRCGLRPEFFEDTSSSHADEEVTLVSVGRLTHEKGHLVLLDSLRRIPRAVPLSVVIIGDGPLRGVLEDFARANHVVDRVTFLGWRSSEEIRSQLRSSTALVMPSFAEGLPVSIMEAYALGKPVISSDGAATSELVRPDETGWLVSPGSAVQLSAAITDLMETPSGRLHQMGAHGRELVAKRHDLLTETRRLRALVHQAASVSTSSASSNA